MRNALALRRLTAMLSVHAHARYPHGRFPRGFTPLPLDGAHDAAFAVSAIPLGAGLPKKR